ncbi:hypothetical protein K431DRAFT_289516 [Polychaeton citri CBS 116435]|uniref:Uncharacterized protein n=1 Tax=Polychaeton citri CBS 116435 TaxID=1314669 RepID=A0A9P4PYB9_9PEZI|nr:hypothetical protein K431DRAFT_289516 [Polychaeton citri CBS 116435]
MNIFRETYAYLPPPAETLAILVGCLELIPFGLGGLADRKAFAKGYGLPIDSQTQSIALPTEAEKRKDEETKEALVAAIAVRNLEKGLMIMAFACYWRDRKALGTVLATGFVTTVVDLLVVRWYGLKEAVPGHWIGVVNSTLIGGSLLYWNRNSAWWWQTS